jgi:hypothetical protein
MRKPTATSTSWMIRSTMNSSAAIPAITAYWRFR